MKNRRTQLSFIELFESAEPEVENLRGASLVTFPERFVTDVDQFLNYCIAKPVSLTKSTKTISRKHLIELNELLSVKAKYANPYSPQEFYPYIHFLFQLTLTSKLLVIGTTGGKDLLRGTKRTEQFKELTFPEKYCSLLEAFWVDMDWERLNDRSHTAHQYVEVFAKLRHETPGRPINIVNPQTEIGELLELETLNWQHFYKYFEWFGLWTCETDTEKIENHYRKGAYFVKRIAVTEFGTAIMPVLVFKRNLYAWNVTTRRKSGEPEWFPGAPLEGIPYFEISNSDNTCIEENCTEDQSGQPFHFPFIPLFPEGTLSNTLPREQKRLREGAYTFEVKYDKGMWRKLKLPGIGTMDDLHHNILLAYDFDDDHLYSFFMDGKKWSNNCIVSPHDTFGHPDASKVRIDSFGFVQGQQFLYLYDYGDEWTFRVTVEQIDEQNTNNFTPQLVGEKGDGPEQYFYEDWDEDDEDE